MQPIQSSKSTLIAASILSANFSCLREEVQAVDAAGIVEAIRPITVKPLNVH
jgi:hypothetical protein